MERSCQVKINLESEAAKNLTARASAGSPIDFFTVVVFLMVQKLNKWVKNACIDFGADYQADRAAEGNRGPTEI
jgi:hypothetical protein